MVEHTVKCDICGFKSLFNPAQTILPYRWVNAPLDNYSENSDICPQCWNKIKEFSKTLKQTGGNIYEL